MKRIVLVVLCLGLIIGGFAQQYINPKRILTPKQMKIDATYYFYEMERTWEIRSTNARRKAYLSR